LQLINAFLSNVNKSKMEHKTDVKWTGKMSFLAEVDGHQIQMDAEPDHGGDDKGARPKKLLLAGLAGCTGMDVISILEKMKMSVSNFEMHIAAQTAVEHPKVYEKIHLVYEFWGKELPLDKIEKAVNLSREKYCAVNAMLGKTALVEYEIIRHEQ
jgi:putative redox protein